MKENTIQVFTLFDVPPVNNDVSFSKNTTLLLQTLQVALLQQAVTIPPAQVQIFHLHHVVS